ncbi:MAG TPA: hypothetical protein VE871_17745, partial [Longimicrobium sp.]|nr:hypothetical protein [Longimicrobium sp.]
DLSQERIAEALDNISRNLDRQVQKGIITKPQETNTLLNIQGFNQLEPGVKDADLYRCGRSTRCKVEWVHRPALPGD